MIYSRRTDSLAIAFLLAMFSTSPSEALGQTDRWRAEVLPVELTVGYAVRLVDLSGDGKLDIAIVDSKRFIWLEAPHWQTHVMHAEPEAKFDNVCFAPHDIDNNGDIDFAVGRDWQFGNSDSGGHIGWLRSPPDPRDPWTYHPISEEPTTHRMNWIDWDRDGSQELVVLPLKGRGSRPPALTNSPIRVLSFTPPTQSGEDWKREVLDESLHVAHNFDVTDLDGDQKPDMLLASFEGVSWMNFDQGKIQLTQLGSGQPGEAPAIGSSEIRLGQLQKSKPYIATIEPWHGDKVVVYTEPTTVGGLWQRHVLDEDLKWGHAVACANLDEDPEQELIIGVRDDAQSPHRRGVRIYDPQDVAHGKWNRTLIEPGQVAVEDLAVGDIDGDGDVDIVAVGRATHNAVIYWNQQVTN